MHYYLICKKSLACVSNLKISAFNAKETAKFYFHINETSAVFVVVRKRPLAAAQNDPALYEQFQENTVVSDRGQLPGANHPANQIVLPQHRYAPHARSVKLATQRRSCCEYCIVSKKQSLFNRKTN